MKTRMIWSAMTVAALAMPLFMMGCDREVSKTTDTTVKSDGTVKSSETVVRQSPNGTVTKEETKSSNTPPPPQ